MIFYIHGFNSSAKASSGRLLAVQLAKPVHCLEWRGDASFKDNMKRLGDEIFLYSQYSDVLVGTSMGGFYALALAQSLGIPCVAFNPVTEPKLQLAMALGKQVNFSTGEEWEFTKDVLDTYPECINIGKDVPAIAYVSEIDEMLKGNLAIARKHVDKCIPTKTSHRMKDFALYLDVIRRFEGKLGKRTALQ